MKFAVGNLYHVYNRGINRQKVFFRESNYEFFLGKLGILKDYCDILAWCLMPNHFHLLIYVDDLPEKSEKLIEMPRKIGTVLSSYAQAINKQETRFGSLFQAKTKAKEIDDKWGNYYGFTCFNYIHQNPIKSGLTYKLEDWKYSSFVDYLGFRREPLVNVSRAVELLDLPTDRHAFYEQSYRVIQDRDLYKLQV